MSSRGARRFVFLGRSGLDKPSARDLVAHLEEAGAEVTVVRGDVGNAKHVSDAMVACTKMGQIGGVVQAAMGLHEALFSDMSSEAWHKAVVPKLAGTMNLDAALQDHGQESKLDFFLLTSSVSGSVGTATESNYCAANAFLDAFAQWRRSEGKTAVSIGLGMISEVGYLHENPDIEALLLRRGIHPLNEADFLQVVDFGIAGIRAGTERQAGLNNDPFNSSAHILTGLESLGLTRLLEQGFNVDQSSIQRVVVDGR